MLWVKILLGLTVLTATTSAQLKDLVDKVKDAGGKAVNATGSAASHFHSVVEDVKDAGGKAVNATGSAASHFHSVVENVKDTGERVVTKVVTPVGETIVANTMKNCQLYKELMGSTFDKMQSEGLKVSLLNMDFWHSIDKKTRYSNVTVCANQTLNSKMIDLHEPLVIFVHGFQASGEGEAAQTVCKALLSSGFTNVLSLDSGRIIKYFYLKSSTAVRLIGENLGDILIDYIRGGVKPSNIHIIGHSLGSHIAGFAGKTVYSQTGNKIGRISSLDPAGPCFFQEQSELRLNSTDADFVDVIHSDAGLLGIVEPLGHVDFYPNGGGEQPGCMIPPCSHSRAWQLYGESITDPTSFPSTKCNGWDTFSTGSCKDWESAYMGYGVDQTKRGIFYVKTLGKTPYGLESRISTSTTKSLLEKLIG